MNSTIITFYISGLGIVGLIFLKYREINSGKTNFLSGFMHRFNGLVSTIWSKVKFFICHINKKGLSVAGGLVLVGVMNTLRSIYLFIHDIAHEHPHSASIIKMVNGEKPDTKAGAVSFYLKSISEELKK